MSRTFTQLPEVKITAPNQLKWKPITSQWLVRIETVSASLDVFLNKANELLTFQMGTICMGCTGI